MRHTAAARCPTHTPTLAVRPPSPPCSSYAPAFLGAAALCFTDGFNKTGLLDDIKFMVGFFCFGFALSLSINTVDYSLDDGQVQGGGFVSLAVHCVGVTYCRAGAFVPPRPPGVCIGRTRRHKGVRPPSLHAFAHACRIALSFC